MTRARSLGPLLVVAAVVAAAVLLVPLGCGESGSRATVSRTIDGDTFELTDGRRVRMVQIDTTELSSHECYARKAGKLLARFLPRGTRVRLEADAALDSTDVYGRLLRYVIVGSTNLNLELVRRGAATPYFFRGAEGEHAEALLAAARAAREAGRGVWGQCRIALAPDLPATAFPRRRSTR